MSDWVTAIAKVVAALAVVVAGWIRIDHGGAERERRKQAERERDAANVRAGKAAEAPASPKEVVGILRRLRDRRERMRKASGGR